MNRDRVQELPLSVGDLTADALTAMLSSTHPGVRVTAVRVERVIAGTCTKVIVRLSYGDECLAHGLPSTVCVKAGFEDHGLTGQIYPREVWFYQHLAQRVGGSLPRCYFAGRNERQAVIVMEDLLARGARFATASDAATVEQVRSMLQFLAILHGRFWDGTELDGLAGENPRPSGCTVLDFSDGVLYQPVNFERMMRLPRAATVPRQLRDLDTARHYLARLIRCFDAGPRCLIHGDAHLGNTYYLDGSADAGFLDWQTYTAGHWSFDVSHLLCTALTPAVRRLHERELIASYLRELERNGGQSPGMNAAWLAYRRMAFYAFAWVLCPPQLQLEEVCAGCASRALAAIDDLGTLEALDAPEDAPS